MQGLSRVRVVFWQREQRLRLLALMGSTGAYRKAVGQRPNTLSRIRSCWREPWARISLGHEREQRGFSRAQAAIWQIRAASSASCLDG
jgi:hypothetical protein